MMCGFTYVVKKKKPIKIRVNRSLLPVIYDIFSFFPVNIFFYLSPVKKFCFDLPPSRPNKNQFYFFFKKFSFLFDLLGVKSKQFFYRE